VVGTGLASRDEEPGPLRGLAAAVMLSGLSTRLPSNPPPPLLLFKLWLFSWWLFTVAEGPSSPLPPPPGKLVFSGTEDEKSSIFGKSEGLSLPRL
jgi:hypothetical protein